MEISVNRKVLLLLALVASMYQSSVAQCSLNLMNVVLRENETHKFPVDTSNLVMVRLAPSSDPFNRPNYLTDDSAEFNPKYKNVCTLDQSGLNIPAASSHPVGSAPVSASGMYTFTVNDGGTNCSAAVKVIVISKELACGCSSSNPLGLEYNCSVEYADSNLNQMLAVFTWMDGHTGSVLHVHTAIPIKTGPYHCRASSTLTRQSVRNRVLDFGKLGRVTCQLSFNAPQKYPIVYVARNEPDYVDECVASELCPPTLLG